MTILIVGGTGTIGAALASALGGEQAISTSRLGNDGGIGFDPLRDPIARIAGKANDITHVVLSYGIAGVGACAADPKGTAEVNVWSVLRMASEARSIGLRPVFISSDYVFDGTKAQWSETDQPSPLNEYGRQKLVVEKSFEAMADGSLVVRFSRVIGDLRKRRCILFDWVRQRSTSSRIVCATNQRFSPVAAADAGRILAELIKSGADGLVHLAGPEAISRMALYLRLQKRARLLGMTDFRDAEPCALDDIPSAEPHPHDTTLSIERLKELVQAHFTPLDNTLDDVLQAASPTASWPKG